ncbi:MAG: hypothetical protein KDA38_09955, partial [Planctomycetales bacterium]|nr:hypothetical protein [Planctomycetales bacterium]
DAGCDACLTKPIKRHELLAGLAKHLQRTSLAADLVSKAEANIGLRHLSDAETETQRVKQLVALPL